MKVLWVGDAVVNSGFARCTRAACGELFSRGHEVHVLGINYYGDPHPYPYNIYPCRQPLDGGLEAFGVTRLPRMVYRMRPDVVVILNDPWNIPIYMESLKDIGERAKNPIDEMPPVVANVAVDGKNYRGSALNSVSSLIAWTDFGLQELRRCGYEGEGQVIPLGVDHGVFQPKNREESFKVFQLNKVVSPDDFVVGVVGRNQPRKRLDLAIGYFADWIHRYKIDNAYLYLHVAPTGEVGCDLPMLTRYHGVFGKVLVCDQPVDSGGVSDADLPYLYSSFDVLLSTTQGEGWGLPVLEAMACGVPCVVPAWSGLNSWTSNAALQVACDSTCLSAPFGANPYVIGGVPSAKGVVWALHSLYSDKSLRGRYTDRGLKKASEFSWVRHGAEVADHLEGVVESVQGGSS